MSFHTIPPNTIPHFVSHSRITLRVILDDINPLVEVLESLFFALQSKERRLVEIGLLDEV